MIPLQKCRLQLLKNANDIAEIIKKIGEKGDNSLKDTVYGFIQGHMMQ